MLAQRAPMGWNTWNTFGENINEQLIMEMADEMVSGGYLEAGYEYIVIDDCWQLRRRNEKGELVADPEKFPHGMKYLSDYVHAKGLKFGIYSCAGSLTCAGYPGSYGHEYQDARTFAEMGVDFLKYDFCYFPRSGDCRNAYITMSMALKATGREILFSACNWGKYEPWEWMRSVGVHMYRSTGDIHDSFVSFRDIIDSQMDKFSMSAPGCYNDIDMLVCGMYGEGNVGFNRGGCTDEEYRTHFALWCLFSAPLMIGGDLRKMNDFTKQLLTHPDLLAINQDEECRPPFRVESNHWLEGETRRFVKHLSGGEYALALVNFAPEKRRLEYCFEDIGIPVSSGYGLEIRDVFSGEVSREFDNIFTDVEGHGIRLWRAKLIKR
jgi:alpha-galactosidase